MLNIFHYLFAYNSHKVAHECYLRCIYMLNLRFMPDLGIYNWYIYGIKLKCMHKIRHKIGIYAKYATYSIKVLFTLYILILNIFYFVFA